jgi:peroxiredoxin
MLCLVGIAVAIFLFWHSTTQNASPGGPAADMPPSLVRPGKQDLPSYAFEPLTPGDRVPAIEAEGWVNGVPHFPNSTDSSQTRLLVLDLWAAWCPVCQVAPPGLIGVYHKYHHRNVRFVSLTDASRRSTELLVSRFSIPWPSGFGASDQTVEAFGALRREALEGRHELNPIVYLIDPDGRILWTDGNARPKHEDFRAVCLELDREIEAALSRIAEDLDP